MNGVLSAIGNTPLVLLESFKEAEVYAKLEFMNPGGSVKDRVALAMVEGAEKKGLLKGGKTIVEPTTGNTGIALAMVSAAKGYKFAAVMPENMSKERRKIMKAFGAEIVLTKKGGGVQGSVEKARELAEKNGWVLLNQFENKANPLAHGKTTAKEIAEQIDSIDFFVSGIGTGGTITGVAGELKKSIPLLKAVGVYPLSEENGHGIEGIGDGFEPKVLDRGIIDLIERVSYEEAAEAARELAKKEGLFAGPSAGAALVAAKRLGKGKIVVVLPDSGMRYLSTGLWK